MANGGVTHSLPHRADCPHEQANHFRWRWPTQGSPTHLQVSNSSYDCSQEPLASQSRAVDSALTTSRLAAIKSGGKQLRVRYLPERITFLRTWEDTRSPATPSAGTASGVPGVDAHGRGAHPIPRRDRDVRGASRSLEMEPQVCGADRSLGVIPAWGTYESFVTFSR